MTGEDEHMVEYDSTSSMVGGLTQRLADDVLTSEEMVKTILEYCENSISAAQEQDLLADEAGKITCEITKQEKGFKFSIQENGLGLTKTALELQIQNIGASKTEQSDELGLWLIALLRLTGDGYFLETNPRTEQGYDAIIHSGGAEIMTEDPTQEFFGTCLSLTFEGEDITAPQLGEAIRTTAQDCEVLVEYNLREQTDDGEQIKKQFHY